MKKSILLIVGIIVIVVIAYTFFPKNEVKEQVVGEVKQEAKVTTYANPNLGLQFDYPTGSNGYVLTERGVDQSNPDLIQTIMLTATQDVRQEPVGGEGPPTITIYIAKNAKKQFPLGWATENASLTNINLKRSEPEESVVGGANAIRYEADGLYPSDNVVAASGENAYAFMGAYMEKDSKIHEDFKKLLTTVKFIKQPGQE